jgi:hypothetical protein
MPAASGIFSLLDLLQRDPNAGGGARLRQPGGLGAAPPMANAPPGTAAAAFNPPQQPENPAVRQYIDAQLGQPLAPGQGPYVGNASFEGARQPGLSGYFDLQPGNNIVPKILPAEQMAAQSGVTPQQLAGGFFPEQHSAAPLQTYQLPLASDRGDRQPRNWTSDWVDSDRGGFFNAENLWSGREGGVPSMGRYNSSLPSTNNWRLLGMGPGYIMRNGMLIKVNDPGTSHGYSAGGTSSGGASGEQIIWTAQPLGLGTGASIGVPNLYASGGQPGRAGWPGQVSPWFTLGWLTS